MNFHQGQKVKRKDCSIVRLKQKHRTVRNFASKVQTQKDRTLAKYQKKQKEKPTKHAKSIQCRPVYTTKSMQANSTPTEIKKMGNRIAMLENDLQEEQEKINKIKSEHSLPMPTRNSERGQPFNSKVRSTVYEFLGAGVPANKIAHLIKITLQTLAG